MGYHVPVMPDEVIQYLNCKPGKIIMDGTVGGAGHSKAIIRQLMPDGWLICLDQDPDAIRYAITVLKPYESQVRLIQENFDNIPKILEQMGIRGLDGILLDLGMSTHQITSAGRGFSFMKDEPLDMRMDPNGDLTAEMIVNDYSEQALADIFFKFGEERRARTVAKNIVKIRSSQRIERTSQLVQAVLSHLPGKYRHASKIHPATRIFQALRIAVNRELERLEHFMENVPNFLNPGARLCVIAFHSLEDRIVKHKLKFYEKTCTCHPSVLRCACNGKPIFRIITKKALRPTQDEIDRNPLARSARLRVAEKNYE